MPALAGLGAPHWRPEARGILTGITGGTTRAHIARATLDGIALQIDEILSAMSQDLGAPLAELRVDGGAARNNALMQRQADLLGVPCVRPEVLETTGLGSGLLAGMAVGMPQADGSMRAEPRMTQEDAAAAVHYMASLPPGANVLQMTVMATNMPFVGRG